MDQEIKLQPLNSKLVTTRMALVLLGFSLLILHLIFLPLSPESLFPLLFFSLAIFLTDLIDINIEQEGNVRASFALILAAVLLGSQTIVPIAIMLAVIVAGAGSPFLRNKNFLDAVLTAAARIIAISLSSLVVLAVSSTIGLESFWTKLICALLAAPVYFVTQTSIQMLVMSIKNGTTFRFSSFKRIRMLSVVYLTFTIIALLMVIMFKWMNFWSFLIFSLPLVATSQSFKLYLTIRQTYASTIKALSATLEAQDSKREGHAQRTADYATAIGREMGFYGNDLEKLNYAALLHDIGKLGFDKNLKTEELSMDYSPADKRNIPLHAHVGSEIVNQVDYLKDVSSIIKYHHYTGEKAKLDVPLESKIINVANEFDHLINKSKLSVREARRKITDDKGIFFDPKVVRAFIKVVSSKN